jgi:hypothetical protein
MGPTNLHMQRVPFVCYHIHAQGGLVINTSTGDWPYGYIIGTTDVALRPLVFRRD